MKGKRSDLQDRLSRQKGGRDSSSPIAQNCLGNFVQTTLIIVEQSPRPEEMFNNVEAAEVEKIRCDQSLASNIQRAA